MDEFYSWYARCEKDWKWNFISLDWERLLDKWCNGCSNIIDWFAEITYDKLTYIINSRWKKIANEWFDYVYNL